jgi:hypothetical protein
MCPSLFWAASAMDLSTHKPRKHWSDTYGSSSAVGLVFVWLLCGLPFQLRAILRFGIPKLWVLQSDLASLISSTKASVFAPLSGHRVKVSPLLLVRFVSFCSAGATGLVLEPLDQRHDFSLFWSCFLSGLFISHVRCSVNYV